MELSEVEQLLDFATRDWRADWRGNFGGEITTVGRGADFMTLYLYVHRVRDCEPGVYRWDISRHKLEQLHRGNVERVAAYLSLEQALAGNACFAVSMVADLAKAAQTFGNRGYRYVYFEAGAIGQRLYLGAEALGWNATGIGAFYDDDVHRYLGFLDEIDGSMGSSLDAAEQSTLVMLGSPTSRHAAAQGRFAPAISDSGDNQFSGKRQLRVNKPETALGKDPDNLPQRGISLFAVGHVPRSADRGVTGHASMNILFDNTYAQLPERFFAKQKPARVPEPKLIRLNLGLAAKLSIDTDWLKSADGLAMLAGNAMPHGAEPIAQAYAGHQFGGFVPQLGDGRALLLGEVIDTEGVRYDLQLKGSGRTPFSRGGDGKSALGPVIREYIVSEAMAALGVPTTRALAAVATGESVLRQEGLLQGGVFTRVAASHIRVGTFQYFRARNDVDALRLLADHVIARHYPDAAEAPNPYVALLESVATAQADLIAQWMSLGFIHGVMNTDNTAISGETIDYGPCAFMDAFHPQCVFSSIDSGGRYAWGNQPDIGLWNVTRFAETLLPLLSEDPGEATRIAQAALSRYPERFGRQYIVRSAPNSGSQPRHRSRSFRRVSTCWPPKRSISHFSSVISQGSPKGGDSGNAFCDVFPQGAF